MNEAPTLKRIADTWWPLAASWILMSAELPAISAVIARLQDPAIHLAAYGSVVFPISLIIEAPVIMLLAASTALSKDWDSYLKLRRYMMVSGALLTLLHIIIAFSPLFYIVVRDILGVPETIIEPSRIGLMIMTPWTWSIGYRRFNQGVLIRYGRSKVVSVGTLVRLVADLLILAIGFFLGSLPGIVVGTGAVAFGVIAEAVFIGIRVRPILTQKLQTEPRVKPPLSRQKFLGFYVPLALTSLLGLAVQPIGSAALSRMPDPLQSLAVWPVAFGLLFILRCFGHAYQEVVVALLDNPGAQKRLFHFAHILAGVTTGSLLIFAATPISMFWFSILSGLSPSLSEMAQTGIWFGLFLPLLSVYQNTLQGILVFQHRTRRITESVFLFLIVTSLGLLAGIRWTDMPGLYYGLTAFTIGAFCQTSWLLWNVRRGR